MVTGAPVRRCAWNEGPRRIAFIKNRSVVGWSSKRRNGYVPNESACATCIEWQGIGALQTRFGSSFRLSKLKFQRARAPMRSPSGYAGRAAMPKLWIPSGG